MAGFRRTEKGGRLSEINKMIESLHASIESLENTISLAEQANIGEEDLSVLRNTNAMLQTIHNKIWVEGNAQTLRDGTDTAFTVDYPLELKTKRTPPDSR